MGFNSGFKGLSSLRRCAMWETHFIPGALSCKGQRGIDGLLEEVGNRSSVLGGIKKRKRHLSSKMLYTYLVDQNLPSVVRRSNVVTGFRGRKYVISLSYI
jgi:hypothetical protein